MLREAVAAVVRQGAVPRHIAFIMDGNRRYAERQHSLTQEGHRAGFETLREALKWCLLLRVEAVTVFAFSVDNFKRPAAEVQGLMDLAEEKFAEMLENGTIIDEHGARVCVLGELHLLSPRLRDLMARVVKRSRHHTRVTLNICFAYSSRYEMARACGDLAAEVAAGRMHACDVSPDSVEARLYTASSPPVDLLVRTSGETRLSDFLLWQCSAHRTQLAFVDVLWPEMTWWCLARVILQYQRNLAGVPATSVGGGGGGGGGAAAATGLPAPVPEPVALLDGGATSQPAGSEQTTARTAAALNLN